jgi:hypothetical protein
MSKDKIPDYLDDEDYLAILSIGKGKMSHTKVQKISYILSNVTDFKGKFTAHDYGNFSESIMEKIQSPLNRNIYSVNNDTYSLTTKGARIYDEIVDYLNPDTRSTIMSLVNLLRGFSAEKLEVLTYHMFPEMATKSRVKPKIELMMSELKSKSKIKANREGDTVTLTME